MARIHFLNVKEGDCSIIEHNSGHTTVIDVCNAKPVEPLEEAVMETMAKSERGISGNFQQKKYPVNPISYMAWYVGPITEESHPMRFEILDVEHGFCAYAIDSDGGVLLFDCGHGSANRPSTYLLDRGITNVRRFFVTNYDEDHISDLLAVRRNLHIEVLTRNASMTSNNIRSLKTPPISPAIE